MKHVTCVGFDCDYTLASYVPETFETLAHAETVNKLVKNFGYPEGPLRSLSFDPSLMVRGLVIDKERGNMLKVDRHKYVKLAYHGFTPLTRDDRIAVYNATTDSPLDFQSSRFAMVDTLFSLAEAHLYMSLVELKDDGKLGSLEKSYAELYRDSRAAVDLAHRDGSIKRQIAADPAKYIFPDPLLAKTLKSLRASGKKVFIATNSFYDFTHVVLNFVLEGKTGKDRDDGWLEYFDAVVTAAGKPRFFTERKDLFEVRTEDFSLINLEGGSPMLSIEEEDLPGGADDLMASTAPAVDNEGGAGGKARVFQGGSWHDVHRMLGVKSGSEILYVGDHIYGDVLRSKRDQGWRTLLVLPELQTEIEVAEQNRELHERLMAVQKERNHVEDLHESAAYCRSPDEPELARRLESLVAEHKCLLEDYHDKFHKTWGQLMKTGYKASFYAGLASRYSCVYTSHVSNLLWYSPNATFKSLADRLVHDEVLHLSD
jgi:5'-nucleotidase